MSYDLTFWRTAGALGAAPNEIYQMLNDDRPVDGLASVDTDGFLAAITSAFPAARREMNGNSEGIVCETPDWVFEVTWSPQHVLVCCRRTPNDVMNGLIDIALQHDCRLYDPQIDERFV